MMAGSHGLDALERARLEADGFVVRSAVFDRDERERIARACEGLVADLQAAKREPRHNAGSYLFEFQRELVTLVKWEPAAPDTVQGVEPFAHLNPILRDWAEDPRLVEPCRDIVGAPEVALFTEKLNLKRARQGGRYVLHQDAAYWRRVTDLTPQICTAMLMIDDATIENGCLEVAPGSHREGLQKTWSPEEGPSDTEMDTRAFDESRMIPVEAPAGSVVFFGAYLVHRSLPNRSGEDRRALLYSYQPAGNPHSRQLTRRPVPAAS
jgi:hypothetical protein